MANSNARPILAKPHPDFPLTPRRDGRWSKKIKQKSYIFTGTADEALAEYLRCKDYILLHGRKPPEGSPDGFTVEDLCDHFLTAKGRLAASGEITRRHYNEYLATAERMIKAFGGSTPVESLRPDDFDALREQTAARWGLHRLAGEVQRVRTICKYGFDAGHIDRPVRLGPHFKKPSKATFRRAKSASGPSLLEAAEIRTLINAADVQLRAMILLGINCGFGNADCAQLPFKAIDLQGGWVRFPRGKTGIARKAKLWPETIEAIKVAIAARPTPKDKEHAENVFITADGRSWFRITPNNPVSAEFRKLLNKLKLHTPRKGFYWLRHTFATIASETADQVAVDHVMGHVDKSMAAHYRERISDERLVKVSDFVHAWLFGGEGGAK
jgi:integrase